MARVPALLRALALDGLYLAILLAASPWLVWRSFRTGRYRAGWSEKFLGRAPERVSRSRRLWLHAVSVGEVNLLAPLIAEWSRRQPDWDIVISTTTGAGHALALRKYPEHRVFYLPLDFSWATRRAVRSVRPDILVLAELELWPNLIAAAQARGAKVAVVNGRLSDRSFRGYRRFRWLLAPTLRRLDLVAAQTDEYAVRFVHLGAEPERVITTGSIKFDGANTDRANPATLALARAWNIAPDDIVFLAGSTQDPEESLALQTFRELAPAHPRLRLILVPRHPERFAAVAGLLDASQVPWQLRSRLEDKGSGDQSEEKGSGVISFNDACNDIAGPDNVLGASGDALGPAVRVLLVDRVGELGAWWGVAHVGFVGGSLGPRGGQNMIEPAAYGVAVSFGPKTHNFRDIVAALLAADAAEVIHDAASLMSFVRRVLDDPARAAQLGHAALQVVLANQGATRRTIDALESLDPQSSRAHQNHSPSERKWPKAG